MSGLFANYKATAMGGGVHGQISLASAVIHSGLVSSSDYTVNLATHQDWDDVGTYTLAACYGGEGTQVLSNKTTTNGIFGNGGVDITFLDVAIDGAKVVDEVIHFNSAGTIGTDQLICHHDGFTNVTPNNGDIVIVHNASGIFEF